MNNDMLNKIANIAADFFRFLYGGNGTGYLCLWTKSDRKSKWFKATDSGFQEASAYALSIAEADDVYFNVCLQKTELGEYSRGTTDSAFVCPGIWVDIDMAGDGHKAANLPSAEDALGILKQFPLEPTIIIRSGHGYHVYTLFDNPHPITDEVERSRTQKLISDYQGILRRYSKSRGWTLDNTSDLARILRVPGTVNHKGSPVDVSIISQEDKNRYSFEKFEDAIFQVMQEEEAYDFELDAVSELVPFEESEKPGSSNANISCEYAAADLELIKKRCSFVRHCVEDATVLSEPGWYAFITVAGRCRNGSELTHKYSRPYAGYDYGETEKKLLHALKDTGPYTCEAIRDGLSWTYCSTCPYKTMIKSPISLGYDSKKLKIVDTAVEINDMITDLQINEAKGPMILEELMEDTNYIEALAFLYRNNTEIFQSIIKTLGENSYLKRKNVDELAQLVKRKAKDMNRETMTGDHELVSVSEVCLEIPAAETTVIPPGWVIKDGVYKEIGAGRNNGEGEIELKEISSTPTFITGLLSNLDVGSEVLEVSYYRDGTWKSIFVPREDLMQAKNLVSYSRYGFPVNSINARDLVEYFHNFEKWNISRLPRKKLTHKMGWIDNGNSGFLLGNHFINSEGDLITGDNDEKPEGTILFSPKSDEFGPFAQAFRTEGSYESWVETVSSMNKFPVAMLVFYSAFVPPLLDLVDIPNFTIDLAYRTSSGKTTLQRLAASVYGCPDENKAQTVVLNWDGTYVYFERVSATLYGLPMILNDSKQAKNAKLIDDVIYGVANGRTRGRGTIYGVKKTENVRTVLLSSGESPLVFNTESGGTRTRVITVNIAPFSGADGDTAEIVNSLNSEIKANYGHAAPFFIQYLIKNKEEHLEEWKRIYRERKDLYLKKAEGSDFINRLSDYFAAIDLAGLIAHDALNLQWDFNSPISEIWDEITRESETADRCIEALELFYSYCAANKNLFWRSKDTPDDKTTFVGKWEKDDGWTDIAVASIEARKILTELGYSSPKNILSEWKDRGFLITEVGRCTKRVFGIQCVMVRRSSLEELGIIEHEKKEAGNPMEDFDIGFM